VTQTSSGKLITKKTRLIKVMAGKVLEHPSGGFWVFVGSRQGLKDRDKGKLIAILADIGRPRNSGPSLS
jgi:hypothetical protein